MTEVATPESFERDPSLVWEFYSMRRENMISKLPNKAHKALAQFEKDNPDKNFTLITQNIDRCPAIFYFVSDNPACVNSFLLSF